MASRVERGAGVPKVALLPEGVEFARSVVAELCPRELEVFDDTVEDFADDPVRTVRGVRPNAPVGMGIDLVSMTPYVLSAVGFLTGVVAEKAVGDAYDAVRARVKQAWSRHRTGEPPEPVEAVEAEQVRTMIVVHLTGEDADPEVAEAVARRVAARVLGLPDTPGREL